jgi:hypothetical protein
MHRRITRAFLTASAAGAALATLGFAGVSAAGAATAPAVHKVYTNSTAGYAAGGQWRFRYIETSVKIPARQPVAGNNATLDVALTSPQIDVAAITVAAGGGAGSVTYVDSGYTNGEFHLSPSIGDVVKVSVYRDVRAHRDYLTATNLRTGRTQTVGVTTSSKIVYRSASLTSTVINSQVEPRASDIRLWAPQNTKITNYSGTHGSVFGPWETLKLIDTRTGTATGKVVLSPSYPWNNGKNFGIWLRHR